MYVLSSSCLVSGRQMTDTYDQVLNFGMSRCERKILEGSSDFLIFLGVTLLVVCPDVRNI